MENEEKNNAEEAQQSENTELKAETPAEEEKKENAAPETDEKTDAENNKVMGVLAYIWLLWLVPLLAAPNSKFARYHANQGIVLFIAGLICDVVAGVLGLIPYVGTVIGVVIAVLELVLMIMGIINAVQGQCKPLPIIGKFTILK